MNTDMNTITETTTAINNAATNTPQSTLQKYYDKVFQDGKLVNVHIGMWGMAIHLTENDIKLENKLPNTIKLGKKYIIKQEVHNRFKNMEQKIRNYLYANSFAFPLVNQAHFVPKTKYLEVYTQLSEYRDMYMQMAEEFFEKYEDYKKEAIEFYMQHKDVINVELEQFYPSLEVIKTKFYVDIASFEISLPTNFSEINLQTELAREEAVDQAKTEAQQKYTEQYTKQVNLHMNKINVFVEDVVKTLRAQTMALCDSTLLKIKEKEVVNQKSVKKLLGHVAQFRAMNFLEDSSIENELSKLESLLNKETDFSEDKGALAALEQRLTAIVTEAKSVKDVSGISGEYFRKINC